MNTVVIRTKVALRRFFVAGVSLALGVGLGTQALASLISYESFNYTAGSSLIGQNGGTGFANAWQTNGSPNDPAVGLSSSILSGSLNYTDSKGNQLVTSGGKLDALGLFGTAQPNRDFSGTSGADGTTVWFSFIGVRMGPTTNNTGTPFNPYPRGVNTAFFSNTTEKISIGNSSGMVSNLWTLIPNNVSASNQVTTLAYNNQALAVVRIDYKAGNDDAYLWVNPILGVEPSLSSADAKMLGSFDFAFNRVRPFAGANDAGNSRPYGEEQIDEIRLGTTFLDVTPFMAVPEPSVMVLSLVGAGLLAWRLKRRSS